MTMTEAILFVLTLGTEEHDALRHEAARAGYDEDWAKRRNAYDLFWLEETSEPSGE